MTWDVRLLEEVERWLLDMHDDSYDQVAAAIDKLAQDGPALGRPLVDRIESSRHHNMKELRPGSSGRSEVRVLSSSTLSDEPSCSSLAIGRATGPVGMAATSRSRTTATTIG